MQKIITAILFVAVCAALTFTALTQNTLNRIMREMNDQQTNLMSYRAWNYAEIEGLHDKDQALARAIILLWMDSPHLPSEEEVK